MGSNCSISFDQNDDQISLRNLTGHKILVPRHCKIGAGRKAMAASGLICIFSLLLFVI